MCGIAGVLNFDGSPVDPRTLKRMTDAIAHRGPDGEGFYTDKGVGLGHRRLAIIDLSPAGKQPMVTPNGRYALTYNGEIYNFGDLRSELETFGYQFRSSTDSEVVLNSWAHWGAKCVNKFNGMFAFAIWDSMEQLLHLVRDRYGIKPMYYAHSGGRFLFGSEQRAVNSNMHETKLLDLDAVAEYFTFQNIFSDRTFVQGIKTLSPGHMLTVDSKNQVVTQSKYWDFNFGEPEESLKNSEYESELSCLIQEAVQRQVRSDVEVGAYLSGGIDSAIISSFASLYCRDLKTFTCGFDVSAGTGIELNFDERDDAEFLSAYLGTEQYEVVLKAGDLQSSLDQVAHHVEEPRIGQSYPNFYVSRLASKFVKVVLSGIGGDELFGGYPWRYWRTDESLEKKSFFDGFFQRWSRLADESTLRRLLEPSIGGFDPDRPREVFGEILRNGPSYQDTYESRLNLSLYFEAKTFLNGLLIVEDKLSMSNSLETRVPFLDNTVVDFALRCPAHLKVQKKLSREFVDENSKLDKKQMVFARDRDGKLVLRGVAYNRLPARIATAAKQGFSAPDASWFRGDSIDWLQRRLIETESPIFQILNKSVVEEIVAQHVKGLKNNRLMIWSLLSFDSIVRSW